MRIGFDIDGVLADFCTAYEHEVVAMAGGVNLFQPWAMNVGPVTWNWPEHYGYTKEIVSAVWNKIKASNDFWLNLSALPEMDLFAAWHYQMRGNHEMYFVTARPGREVKLQTELWLRQRLSLEYNENITVLISDQKGMICRALNLDMYVDDKAENVQSVMDQSVTTNPYLIDRAYNRHMNPGRRIASLEEFLATVGWR